MTASQYIWTPKRDELVAAMSWGYGYPGERYWRSEEQWLRDVYSDRHLRTVLSIGCGLFRELETLTRIASDRVIGLDADSEIIELCMSLNSRQIELGKVQIIHGQASELPIPDHSVCLAVVLFNTFGFFGNYQRTLRSIASKVTETGEIIISFWRDTSAARQFRIATYTRNGGHARVQKRNRDLNTIAVYLDGGRVFVSHIITQSWLYNVLVSSLPNSSVEFIEFDLFTVARIRMHNRCCNRG